MYICKNFIKGKEETQMRNQASPKLNKGRVISEYIFNMISQKKYCFFALDLKVEWFGWKYLMKLSHL